jgi:hypothetical protein
MPANYVLLEKITVGAAGAASVTFANIPQTGYTDLVLQGSIRTSFADTFDAVYIYPNGSGANGTRRALYGTGGGAVGSESASNIRWDYFSANTATANTFGSGQVYIPNYTSSNFKSFSMEGVSENNSTGTAMAMTAGLWSSTAAITSLQLTPLNGNFAANSTFYLYGVAKLGTTPAIAPKAAGGDIIDTDGTYWYHTFLSSGTFTPAQALSCDYLVVAGGGGGGSRWGGGGGAGGLRSTVTATGGGGSLETALSLVTSAYTVTVGAGGAGGLPTSNRGASGSNSVFATITSTGGGGGGTFSNTPTTGGSGGGAGGPLGQTGAAGTTNQGFAGGNASPSGGYAGGGGGGAGVIGASSPGGSSQAQAGAGGNGVTTSISGTSTTYAGGGGGGAEYGGTYFGVGGSGGGGNGNSTTNGTGSAGTPNRGAGGGGGGNDAGTGGAGSSGIVIVRYLVA